MVVDPYKARKKYTLVENLDLIFEKLLCTRRKFGFNKKIHTKLTFCQKTVLYTKCVRNTKKYFPPQPKKLTQNTTVWYSKYISSM